ncbi:MAG: NADH-quinone oxidoreductase subunit J, partial [Chloroflexota bacterium]|nr:NADH-quinone oxidoreductase subunit J [Chloroflexota bacterium]
MPWDVIIFYILATVCILAAGGVVISNNPVHAGVFVVLCFFNVAAIFVMLGAEFLAAVQVIVYTGAILVLVLFVLMLVDPDDLPEFHAARPVQRTVGLLLGAILLLEVGAAILNRTVIGQQGNATPENVAAVGGNVQGVGRVLYTNYVLAFEVVSLVLLVGIIGAIVLALPERLGAQPDQRQGTISLGH